MLTRVMYATIYVGDLDRALEFYTSGLGFEKRVDYSGPEGRFLTVGIHGNPLEIVLWPGKGAQGRPAPGLGPGTVPGPIILEADDLKKEFELLGARGVPFEEPEPEDYAFGVRATALDPDGNRISLRERSRGGRGRQ